MMGAIRKIIFFVYKKVIGEEMSQGAFLFLKNLQYAVFGYGFAAFCVLVFEILAGRLLGPEEYGKYVLIGIVGSFLYIFMTMGVNTAVVKYIADKDYQMQKLLVSESYLITIPLIFVWSLLFLVFSGPISAFFSIPSPLFYLSIIFGIFFSFYILSTDNLRGLHKIKGLSLLRAGYGIILLIIFASFFFFGKVSFKSEIFSICLSYLVVSLLILFNLREYFYFKIDESLTAKLIEYGIYAAIGGSLLLLLPTLSQLFVNKYLTIKDVGIYNAYYLSSINLVLFLNNVFIAVFFPAVSRIGDKRSIQKKISKIIPFLVVLGVPCLLIFQLIILNIYGSQYPVKITLSILFASAGIMISIYSLYSWFFYSTGISGARKVMSLTVTMFIIDILLSYYLVPLLGAEGAVISIILTYSFGLIYFFLREKFAKIIESHEIVY